MKTVKLTFALILIGAMMYIPACDILNEADVQTVTFSLKNVSNQDAHLYLDWETIGPDNKVSPGSSRSVSKEYDRSYAFIDGKIYVGRDGSSIGSGSFRIDQNTPSTIVAFWDGQFLSISD